MSLDSYLSVTPSADTPGIAPGTVSAVVTYAVKTPIKPHVLTTALTGTVHEYMGPLENRVVPIHDARPVADGLSLDGAGVELARLPTAVTDFRDPELVERVHDAEVTAFLKARTGARAVAIFDRTLRTDAPGRGSEVREVASRIHNDYTDWSGWDRVRAVLGTDDLDALGASRVAQVNLWRPINGPVRRSPLAVVDARSVDPEDLLATDMRYADRTGEIYHLAWNPAHRWLYFPEMTDDEVMLIKGWDSETDGRARFTPHTAFDDPTTPPDAPARQSIETRTLLVF